MSRKNDFDKSMEEAEKEAIRFLEKIRIYKESDCYYKNNDGYSFYQSKDRAGVKRSSMDLTRSLTAMRKASVY